MDILNQYIIITTRNYGHPKSIYNGDAFPEDLLLSIVVSKTVWVYISTSFRYIYVL
jgi:hypothetical protein